MSYENILDSVKHLPEKSEDLVENLERIQHSVSSIKNNLEDERVQLVNNSVGDSKISNEKNIAVKSVSSVDKKLLSYMETFCDNKYYENNIKGKVSGGDDLKAKPKLLSIVPSISKLMGAIYSEDIRNELKKDNDVDSSRILETANIIKGATTKASGGILQSFNNMMKNEIIMSDVISSTINVGMLRPLLGTQIIPFDLFGKSNTSINPHSLTRKDTRTEFKKNYFTEPDIYTKYNVNFSSITFGDLDKSEQTVTRTYDVSRFKNRNVVMSSYTDMWAIMQEYRKAIVRGDYTIYSNFESQMRFGIAYKVLNALQKFIYDYLTYALTLKDVENYSGYVELSDIARAKAILNTKTGQTDFYENYKRFSDIENNAQRGRGSEGLNREHELLTIYDKVSTLGGSGNLNQFANNIIPTMNNMNRIIDNFTLATGMDADTMLVPHEALRRIYSNRIPRNVSDTNYVVNNVDSSFNRNISFERYEQSVRDVENIARKYNALGVVDTYTKVPFGMYDMGGRKVRIIPFFEDNTMGTKKLFRWQLNERQETGDGSGGNVDQRFLGRWCVFEGGLINSKKIMEEIEFNSKPIIRKKTEFNSKLVFVDDNYDNKTISVHGAVIKGGFLDDAVVGKFQAAAGNTVGPVENAVT